MYSFSRHLLIVSRISVWDMSENYMGTIPGFMETRSTEKTGTKGLPRDGPEQTTGDGALHVNTDGSALLSTSGRLHVVQTLLGRWVERGWGIFSVFLASEARPKV